MVNVITCLGTGGYFPTKERQTSSYILKSDHAKEAIIFDAGTGITNLRHGNWQDIEIFHILLSHLHLDHTIGLTYLYGLRKVLPKAMFKVYCSHAEQYLLLPTLFASRFFDPDGDYLKFVSLDFMKEMEIASFRVKVVEQQHGLFGSRGFEINNKDIAYFTDTTVREKFDRYNILLHECYNLEYDYTDSAHSSAEKLAETLDPDSVILLVLTHINPFLTDTNLLLSYFWDRGFDRNSVRIAEDSVEYVTF